MESNKKHDDLIKKSNQKDTSNILQAKNRDTLNIKEIGLKDQKITILMSPSEYIKQISLSPEKILVNNFNKNRTNSSVFTPDPSILVFKKFRVGNVYNIALHIRNTSQVPHHVKLMTTESLCFKIVFKGSTLNTRLAPGMTHIYDVKFQPDERRDYFHDIIFKTDIGSFSVPVIALGPRALLSFPDQIDMKKTAVKVVKTKPILIQNIGEMLTGFSIFTDNPCFQISPSKGSIEVNEAIQVKVNFTPKKIGISSGCIFLRYESGYTVQSIIYGEADDCDVQVLEENVQIESTFLGLSRLSSIEIRNNSDYVLKCEWRKYKNMDDDIKEKEKYKKAIEPTIDLPSYDAILPNAKEVMCRRIYSDRIDSLMNEAFPFSNDHFQIFPMNGDIWPRNSTKVSVTFHPKTVGEISTVAYLEIDGRENRIPVSLSGKCIGPALELNLLLLDIQEVYLCATYNYEVVCKNAGPVPGTLSFVQKTFNFGSKITVEPCETLIAADEIKSINISFYSEQSGTFVERIDFIIRESLEVLSFVLKGIVICPLVRIDKEEVDFHAASLGFTMEKQLTFRNLSHMPVQFSIKIPSDGYEAAITHEEFARVQIKPNLPSCPREFCLYPNEGVAEAGSKFCVKVFYTPNLVRSGSTQIHIGLYDSPKAEPLILTIKCDARLAIFDVIPAEVNIRFCFLNYPYYRSLTVINNSDVDGYFYIIPQEISSNTTVLYSLSMYQGYLKSGQSKEIMLTIIVKAIGKQETNLSLFGIGFEIPISCCEIICNGHGPVVSVEPSHLDWGEIRLLQKQSLTLELINDSPIAAEFHISLSKSKSIWEIEPSCGELHANESMSLAVSIFLRDTGKYTDSLSITIFNGKTININLSAIGIGTCIVFNPDIFPVFDMGFRFCRQDTNIPISIKNEGTRHHYLLLTNEEKVRQVKKSPVEEIEKYKFKIEPNTLELLPGSITTVYCKIRWNINEPISEQWYIYATIESQGKRELLGTSNFTATFIEPNVIFDKNEVTFRLDLGCNHEMLQQQDNLQISNQSGRNLNAHVTIDPPFLMIDKCNWCTDHVDVTLINDKPINLKLYFPFDVEKSKLIPQRYNGSIRIEYDEHKNVDNIPLKAIINFPHLIFEPQEINIYCVSGYSAEEKIKMINDSPLPVFYRIKWLKETFRYQRLFTITEGGSEGSMTEKDFLNNRPISSPSPKVSINLQDNTYDQTSNDDQNECCTDNFNNCCNADLCECYEDYSDKSLTDIALEIPSMDLIDKFLQVTPEEGQIPPFTEQYIAFTFNGFENAKMSIQAICEVGRGSTQVINVNATADTVRCEIQDYILDYGLQLFCEPSVTTLRVTNQCMIPVHWSIETTSDLLQTIQGPKLLDPMSECLIAIERRPSLPGLFREKLFIEVTHLEPFIVEVKWLATIPQIYLEFPRDTEFEKYPVEFGYEAVKLVMSESMIQEEQNIVEVKCSSSEVINDDSDITEYEMMELTEDDWHVIAKDERCPSQIDIDMAFERFIAIDILNTHEYILTPSNSDLISRKVPPLLAPAYCVNMNFVVVDQTMQVTLSLRNYGYEKAKVKLTRDERKQKLAKSCFFVQLERNVEICQCETTTLNVVFSPKKEFFPQKRIDISYKFYLEVKRGLTIPVYVSATAVYPYVTVSTQTLNFEKVFIGDCREICFILKNEGFVECEWEMLIDNALKISTKSIENPFSISSHSGVFIPGQQAIIKVHFKPYKNGYQKRNLTITVRNNQENETICLIGCGVERKLKINKMNINFPPIVPNSTVVEENLIIENKNLYSIELYWQHLENFSESNRIIRILKHYYKTDEILIPQRKIGDKIPQILIDFYNYLTTQMCSDDEFKPSIENIVRAMNNENQKSSIDVNKSKSKGHIENTDSLSPLDTKSDIDSCEVENLLHAYIDKLQASEKFFEKLKVPLTEFVEDTDILSSVNDSEEKFTESKKKLVILFHGAPFTKYQETACRCAKALNIPVLNLNQIFLEAMTFAQTENANKLAKSLDNRYIELIKKLEKNATLSKRNSSDFTIKILKLLHRLPPPEEFERMQAYTYYEHKFEISMKILSLIESTDGLGSPKGKGHSIKGQNVTIARQSVLPTVSQDMFKEILRERLSERKFSQGYVLQTLNNDFMTNETSTLKILLEATGKDKLYLFVTFHNTFELYETRFRKLKEKQEEAKHEIIQRLEILNQLEINQLPEEEKILYNHYALSKNQPSINSTYESKTKTAESRIDLKEFDELQKKKRRLTKIHEKDNISNLSWNDFNSKDVKEENTELHIPDAENIEKAMKEYKSGLNNLLETINEWETGKTTDFNKNLKGIKGQKNFKVAIEPGLISTDKCFMWHIRADDPWDTKLIDVIVSQISTNVTIIINNCNSASENKSMKPTTWSRTYTVLKESTTLPKSPALNTTFCITPQNTLDESQSPLITDRDFDRRTSLNTNSKSLKPWVSSPTLPAHAKEICIEPEARWLLHAFEKRRFAVRFQPTYEGSFENEFLLSLVDNPDIQFKINVRGVAAVPRLDLLPISVFDRVKTTKVSEAHEPAYFLDSQVYDFGSLLVTNRSTRFHKKNSQFKLRNISVVPMSVKLCLLDDSDSFDIDPQNLEIQPNETGLVQVTAHASKLGSTSDNLVISTKNNDQPEIIPLKGCGIKLQVELEPKQLNFGRILLYRTERQIMTIKNKTATTIYWRLSTDATETQIQLSATHGKIKYNRSCEIEFQYYANKVQIIETKFLSLEFYLNEKDTEPSATDIITINAEIYEIVYEGNFQNLIDLGNIPIGSTAIENFVIKNLGSYEIQYEFQFQAIETLKKFLNVPEVAKFQQDFIIHPTIGVILPKNEAKINITFTPTIEMSIKSVPLLKYLIIEPHKNLGIVSETVLNISVASYYTRIYIEPHPNLNFGSLALNSTKAMQLEIKNIGKFPLQYSIVNQLTENPSTIVKFKDEVTLKKTKKTPNQDKGLINRKSISTFGASMKLGPFHLEKTKGDLSPGQNEMLSITCWSNSIGYCKEKLIFLVPNILPTNMETTQISLVANICVADINFQNYVEMFKESHIVDAITDFDYLYEFNEHTIFSKMKRCLYFRCVCVETHHAVPITLRNTGAVSGDVILEIVESSSMTTNFKVDTTRLNIPSMSRRSFMITFNPSSLGTFSSSLKMTVDLPQDYEVQSFSIDIEGQSFVPQIRILEPIAGNTDNPEMYFGLTYISDEARKILKIQNIGHVPAKVVVEIIDDSKKAYAIHLDKDQLDCGCTIENIGNATFRIIPKEIVSVYIHFHPTKMEKYSGRIRISVDKNPYEIMEVNLLGKGFIKSVILDNLEIVEAIDNLKKSKSQESARDRKKSSTKQDISLNRFSSTEIYKSIPLIYNLDFGKCFLNRMSKVNFKIVNKTSDLCFKFEWDSHPEIVCVPSAGHLLPNSFKELSATFLASVSTLLSQVSLNCVIHQIILDEQITELSWDTRQTKVSWLEKYSSHTEEETFDEEELIVKKTIKETKEPIFQIIPETLQSIQLLISAIADFSNYDCDVSTLDFNDTLMFQTREHKFVLRNTGPVNLDYTWVFSMDEQYPIRLDQTNLISALNRESSIGVRERDNKNNVLNDKIPSNHKIEQQKILRIESEGFEDLCDSSDLFSSSAALSNRSTDTWIEGDNCPFEIAPESGSLAPNEVVECSIKFLPVDVFEYKAYLQCKMENLSPERETLSIIITAKSLLPYCHFDVEESDYFTRRNMELPGPVDYCLADSDTRDKIRVVEFKLMGIAECHTRDINLINPTTEDYSYHWTRLSNTLMHKMPIFQCLSETGVAETGKKTKITFTIIPESTGLFETFWNFEIKKYCLETLFVIVANVTEPSVTCKNDLMKLDACIIDETRLDSFEIINNESCSLSFCVRLDSTYSDGRLQFITIYPENGILQPNSCQMFNCEYKPSLIGEHMFNVLLQIEKLSKPIKVSIIAEVIKIISGVTYTDLEGQKMKMNENGDNLINIGELMLNVATEIEFEIINLGQIAFEYCWNLKEIKQNTFEWSISLSEGRVDKNCSNICNLKIIAIEKVVVHNHPFILKVKGGPIYRMKLNAFAKKPPLEFSFCHYDFGLCYIQSQDGIPYTTDLIITNNQKIPCTLTCNFDDRAHLKLDLYYLSQPIPKNSSVKVPIYFNPTAEILYLDTLNFFLANSSIQKNITIVGEGILYKIRLKNPCDAIVDFGSIMVGKSSSRVIRVINEGRSPVIAEIIIIQCTSEEIFKAPLSKCLDVEEIKVYKDYMQSLNSLTELESMPHSTKSLDLTEFIRISPNALQSLKPNKEYEVTIQFKSIRRVKSLAIELRLKIDSYMFPFTIVKGNSTMASFYLNRTYIAFGTIFESCSGEEKLVLVNDGDVDSRFSWNVEKVKAYFNITPLSGYSSAGSETIFTCVFKPNSSTNCIEAEVNLKLEGQKNLAVKITGDCCPMPESQETLDFAIKIRHAQTKEIRIHNDTDQIWFLKPLIFGECFRTISSVSIDPKDTKECEITYQPKRETAQGESDSGKLVIILPDGRLPILYDLHGLCTPAVDSKAIVRHVSVKKRILESLRIYNNSNRRKSFECVVEQIDDRVKEPEKVTAFELDVPAKEFKESDFKFYFELEGQYFFKVIFNDDQENYQCYDLEFIVASPEIQSVIEMTSYVRNSILHALKIENPIRNEAISLYANSLNEDIVIHGLPAYLPPLAFKTIQIEYHPLIPCQKNIMLEISSELLGSLFYELHLTAKPAPPERISHIKSSLGSFNNFSLRIKNYSKQSCEFVMMVDEASFTCPKSVSVPSNEETSIDVVFEPYSCETISTIIKAVSDTAGEFIFPVIGESSLPQPQGPYLVTAGTPTSVSFKNVFMESKVFQFSVDNPDFLLDDANAKIESKKSFTIRIMLKTHSRSESETITGKLVVSCTDKTLTEVKWIHYLRTEMI